MGYVLKPMEGDDNDNKQEGGIESSSAVVTEPMDDLEDAVERPDVTKKPKIVKEKRKRSIIQLSSTGLKPNQKNRSIVEIDLLGIVWALEHSRFYTVANPNVHVILDHSSILGIVRKSLTEINNTRIVRLLEQVCHCSLNFSHTQYSWM